MFAGGLSTFITFNTCNIPNHEHIISILQIKLKMYPLPLLKINLCPHCSEKKLEETDCKYTHLYNSIVELAHSYMYITVS